MGKYQTLMPTPSGEEKPSGNVRHFCLKCGSHLWAHDEQWAQWVYPFAGAIDTDLPTPPHSYHIMLGSKASWVLPQVRPEWC